MAGLLGKTLPVIVGSIVGGLFAIVGAYFATDFQMNAQAKSHKSEEQLKVFARLMGRKLVTEQLNLSQAEARMFSDYNEEIWKRQGPQDSLDLEEARHWMQRSQDLVFDVMKNNQALFEDLATAQALFPDTPRLRELTARVYNFRTLKTQTPPHSGSIESLTQWKDEADRQIQSLATTEYGKPIDELTAYLRTQLRQ